MGFNHAEAVAFNSLIEEFEGTKGSGLVPRALPVQALDHAAGYLLAFGINAALCKMMTVSTSYALSSNPCTYICAAL